MVQVPGASWPLCRPQAEPRRSCRTAWEPHTREGASAVGTRSWGSRAHRPGLLSKHAGIQKQNAFLPKFLLQLLLTKLHVVPAGKGKKYLKASDPFPQSRQKKKKDEFGTERHNWIISAGYIFLLLWNLLNF